MMKNSSDITFDDIQGLVCSGHGQLTETCFMLLNIVEADAAKQWIDNTNRYVRSAARSDERPETALQIAFSVQGLQALGLEDDIIKQFSDEFIVGMSGDDNRSRRLGDVGLNAPGSWQWGGLPEQVPHILPEQMPHILLLLYAKENGIKSWRKTVEGEGFSKAFQLLRQLPTQDITQDGKPIEPFGFRDGISQPNIDWDSQQSTNLHDRNRYSNLLAPGEVVLGYPNEYGLYTTRPLIDPENDPRADELPNALDEPGLKDFGRNGTYLVLRQLRQDVPGFWRFLKKTTDSKQDKPGQLTNKTKQLAEAMVGRKLDAEGTPLMPRVSEKIPGISRTDNNFNYDKDPKGTQCPIGAHIRRSNPRTGDMPAGVTGIIGRIKTILGFGQGPDDDLIASTRFHRLLRRGRAYGPILAPEDAIKADALVADRGLQFICLVANISRQFEFVQNAWSMSSKFSGVQHESDPLLGNREPLMSGESTDQFHRPDPAGPTQKTCQLPQFVTVLGGGYFFMPGLRALKYISTLPSSGSDQSS
jgi:deferrochelatase/peroxidase EfeB